MQEGIWGRAEEGATWAGEVGLDWLPVGLNPRRALASACSLLSPLFLTEPRSPFLLGCPWNQNTAMPVMLFCLFAPVSTRVSGHVLYPNPGTLTGAFRQARLLAETFGLCKLLQLLRLKAVWRVHSHGGCNSSQSLKACMILEAGEPECGRGCRELCMLHRKGDPGWRLWGVAVSEVAQAGTSYPVPHLQAPEPNPLCPPLPSPLPISHSCPHLLDGHPQGKRLRFPPQETLKTKDRTREALRSPRSAHSLVRPGNQGDVG